MTSGGSEIGLGFTRDCNGRTAVTQQLSTGEACPRRLTKDTVWASRIADEAGTVGKRRSCFHGTKPRRKQKQGWDGTHHLTGILSGSV